MILNKKIISNFRRELKFSILFETWREKITKNTNIYI